MHKAKTGKAAPPMPPAPDALPPCRPAAPRLAQKPRLRQTMRMANALTLARIALIAPFAAVFLINALTVVPRALLIKAMTFRRISLAQLAGELGFGVVGLVMAVLGYGVWSLGGAVLAQRILNCVFLWSAVDWRPGLSVEMCLLTRDA